MTQAVRKLATNCGEGTLFTDENDYVVYNREDHPASLLNGCSVIHGSSMTIRLAQLTDRQALVSLWQTAPYVHLHAEWQLPVEWLGEPGFVVWAEPVRRALAWPVETGDVLRACLALVADPLPAGWVRIAAASITSALADTFQPLLESAWPTIIEQGITELGWLILEPRTPSFLPHLGFAPLTELETYIKTDGPTRQPASNERVQIRPVRVEDMAAIVRLDAAAYAPLWRYSHQTFTLARPQALTFDVALWDEQIVGSLLSMPGDDRGSAHLVRLTVSPQVQGRGVGRTLMNHFLAQCCQRGLSHISLNTQLDNASSQRLYRQYGFRPWGARVGVWRKEVSRDF